MHHHVKLLGWQYAAGLAQRVEWCWKLGSRFIIMLDALARVDCCWLAGSLMAHLDQILSKCDKYIDCPHQCYSASTQQARVAAHWAASAANARDAGAHAQEILKSAAAGRLLTDSSAALLARPLLRGSCDA